MLQSENFTSYFNLTSDYINHALEISEVEYAVNIINLRFV
jgi:hypothetical protein